MGVLDGAELTTLLCALELTLVPLPPTRRTAPLHKRHITEVTSGQTHLTEGILDTNPPHPKRVRVGSMETVREHPSNRMQQELSQPTMSSQYSGCSTTEFPLYRAGTHSYHNSPSLTSLMPAASRALGLSMPHPSSQVLYSQIPGPYILLPAAFTYHPSLPHPHLSPSLHHHSPGQHLATSETDYQEYPPRSTTVSSQAHSDPCTYHTNKRS